MTAPPSPAHLDDEALSAVLDGTDEAARGTAADHLGTCGRCSVRLEALRAARGALAGAVVPPLPPSVLDELVSAALAAGAEEGAADDAAAAPAPVVPLAPRTGRRVATPPPAWLLGAVAALAAVLGLAGLLRAAGGGARDDMAASSGSEAGGTFEASRTEGDDTVAAADADAATGAAEPDVVVRDLGEIADAAGLAAALDAPVPSTTRTAAAEAREAPFGDEGGKESAPAPPASATPVAGSATGGGVPAGPPDRARCRADAERIGAGRLGTLLTTATLRWAGEPAEVLVFTLVEPAGGFSRQALVLARPGCALLADPRW